MAAAGLLLSLCILAGCDNGIDRTSSGSGILKIYADMEPSLTAGTKTVEDEFGSYDSEAGFSEGDMIGFYSLRGTDGGDAGFSNYPMTYSVEGNYFMNEELVIDYPTNLGYTFAYYPYSADNADVVDIYREDGSIEDILVAGSSRIYQGRIYLGFTHAFSMFIIIPGTGFEEVEDQEQVQVVIRSGKSASVVRDEEAGTISFDVTDDPDAERVFYAVKRTDVILAEGGDEIAVCYSVVLPSGSEIEYFIMKDNHGNDQKIYPDLDPLESGWRYPVNVVMEGTSPVVWPYDILPWETTETVEIGGDFGIGSAEAFMDWTLLYNEWLDSPDDDDLVSRLSEYGEMTDGRWAFRLKADIDASAILSGADVCISEFRDELDGRNFTVTGLQCALLGTLAETGGVKNLNLASSRISFSGTQPVGAIACTMNGGIIEGCRVVDLRLESEGLAGALAGSAVSGTISGNTADGLLLAAGCSDDGLTGERTDAVTVSGNSSSALIY